MYGGDVLRPPHDTTPTAVIARDFLRAAQLLMRKAMVHTAVSATIASPVTLNIWQHGTKENYCSFASLNMIVVTKTSIGQMGPNILNVG